MTEPWRDPSKSLGERALEFTRAEMARGVRENPPGTNAGPEIAAYFASARRNVRGREVDLGVRSGNWCAVAACAAGYAAVLEGEGVPHGYRMGGVELVEDAKHSGAWLEVPEARAGRLPRLGDLAIYDRSDARPESAWWRHVARLSSEVSGDGTFLTIGGNESQGYRETARSLGDVKLLGFVLYPRPPVAAAVADEDEVVAALAQELIEHVVATSDAVIRGEIPAEELHWLQLEPEDDG